jgi:predicted glycogen debranching enzyme
MEISFGPQVTTTLSESARREWLVADGLGGFAMGTVAGLRTRRYHGLLVVATDPPGGRHLGLAALDPVLVLDGRRVRLATHEWGSGVIDPRGYEHLTAFSLRDSVPIWRWSIGDVIVERELAMLHGRSCVGVVHRVIRAPRPVQLEVAALCTWRDVHGERSGWDAPGVDRTADGFTFEGAYRVRGPGFEPGGGWYRDVRHVVEAERGLSDREDLWFAGTFTRNLEGGETLEVTAWSSGFDAPPPPATELVIAARERAVTVATRSGAEEDADRILAVAADQLVVSGPTVVAGYPWFGDWSRDTLTAYEGLLLATRRYDEGRELLLHAAGSLSEGMLANTADAGGRERSDGRSVEYNTVDAALWLLHAVGRHVEVSGDLDLAAALEPSLASIVEHHLAGTRFGIKVDPADGLITQGAAGWALTWMDARVDGLPITPRMGKPVEVNALWISGLAQLAALQRALQRDDGMVATTEAQARRSFLRRFAVNGGLADVVDGPDGDDVTVRPNQLLAAALPYGPFPEPRVVAACAPLLTPLGLRTLAPEAAGYAPAHRGTPAARDAAYHQGTVWPWLIGPYVGAALRTEVDASRSVDALTDHLRDWGLGSVSEAADGAAPHGATGCPFQAWSVAELLRARRLLQAAP